MALGSNMRGQTGASINFDGVDDQIRVPGSTMGAFTIEFWMRTTQVGPTGTQWYNGVGISDSEVSGTANDYGVTLLGNKIAFGTGNPDVTITSTTSVNSGNWVHVAAMFTSNPNGKMWLYINGVLEAFQDPGVSNNTRNTNANIAIGSIQTNQRYFNGDIDEFRLWNYTLSQCEILNRMNCELTLPQSGLLRYYQCNQGIAAANNTTITTLSNLLGTNNANITGMALTGATSNFIAPGAVASGISCNPLSVNVQGNGNNIVDGATTTSTLNGTNFNTLCSNAAPITNSYVIQNNGTSVLSLSSFSIAGANAGSFSITSTVPSTISVGGSASINVQFTPSTVGTKTATVLFNTSDCAFSTYNFLVSSTVIGSPTVSVNSGSICSGSSFVMIPAGASSYTFSSGTSTVSPTSNINYTVTGVDVNGCYSSAISSISVTTTPTISLSDGNVCFGKSYTLTPSGASSYTFYPSGSVVSPTTTSTFSVIGSNNSCISSNTAIATITVNPIPSASITVSKNIFCANDSALFSTTLQSNETIQWYRNGVLQVGQTNSSYSVTLNGNYSAVVTNSDGCTASSNSLNVTVNSLPVVNITTSSANFCPGVTSITLTANSFGVSTYQWLLNGALISGATNQTYAASNSGQYQVVITNSNGCADTSSISNLQNATAQSFSLSSSATSFCSGSTATINTSLQVGATYAWMKNGSPFISPALGQNVITTPSAGSYYVEVTNNFGCVSVSDTITLTMLALPTASISANKLSICSGDSSLLTAVLVAGASYEWFKNNTSLGSPQLGNTSVYANSIGAYKVIVNDGCLNTSNTITITQANSPSAAGSINGYNDFCAGESNSYTIANVSGATSYSWTINPSNAASIASGQGTNSITVNTTNQNFMVSVIPINSCGSGNSSSLNVSLITGFGICSGNVLFAANKTNACVNNTVVFTNYSDANSFIGLTPKWNFGVGASPSTATGNGPFNVIYSSVGLKTVVLEYVDAFNNVFANETKTSYINIFGAVNTSSITGNQLISCNASGIVYQVANTTGSNYNWTVPAGASIIAGQGTNSISVNFGGTAGNISVQETNGGGCLGSLMSLSVSCLTTSVIELANAKFIIYPNPASDFFIIESSGIGKFELFDSKGVLLTTENIVMSKQVFNISNYSKGLYFIKFINDNKHSYHKLVIN